MFLSALGESTQDGNKSSTKRLAIACTNDKPMHIITKKLILLRGIALSNLAVADDGARIILTKKR